MSPLYNYMLFAFTVFAVVEGCKVDVMLKCLHSKSSYILVVTRSHPWYKHFNYQSNIRRYREPTAYIQPQGTRDVQFAVQCAAITRCPITPKSGGHSYEKYGFGTNESFVIDLSKLNSVTVYRSTNTANFGPGATLGQAYYKLWANGRYMIPGGVCPFVGIGGHALGGGIGFSVRKYGMLSDNVVSFEVVTANGNVVVANQHKNSDLFWALRGAGNNNFGIVTNIRTKIHPVSHNITILDRRFKLKDFFHVFNGWQKWVNTNPDNSITCNLFVWNSVFYMLAVINNEDKRVHKKIISDIRKYIPKLEIKETFKSVPFIDVVKYLAVVTGLNEKQAKDITKLGTGIEAKSFKKTKSFYVKRMASNSEVKKLAYLVSKAPMGTFIFFEMHGGAINFLDKRDTAFFHRKGNLYSVMLCSYTSNTSQINEGLKWINLVFDESKSIDSGYSVFNYVDSDLKNWPQRYWGSNYERLQRIKSKYDPNMVFDYKHGIQPRRYYPIIDNKV